MPPTDDTPTDESDEAQDQQQQQSVCGEPTASGEPCQRPAGFGIEGVSVGPCKDHATEYRVPDKLNQDVRQKLTGAANAGAKLEHCAGVAGISRSTLWDWLSRGEDHAKRGLDTELADLYRTFQRARAAGAVKRLQNADDEFVLQASYGYTKTTEHAVDMEADVETDAEEAYIKALEAGLDGEGDAVEPTGDTGGTATESDFDYDPEDEL